MDIMSRIERALVASVARAETSGCPPRLAEAMRYAVFPRGARIRPRLCLSVAAACGDDNPALSEAAGAAIELLHCASLVHDDLPCFDDAATRRGKPSVHRAFGEPLAVLAGDALIVLAFQILAPAARTTPERLPAVLATVGDSVGVPFGICAGQAWECEPGPVDLSEYQRQKTGALFAAATIAGAAAAGAEHAPWRALGQLLGEAYQVADDLRDAVCPEEEMGKPAGQDAAHGRPSAVLQFGLDGAVRRLESLTGEAAASIPDCPGGAELRKLILLEAGRLLPRQLASAAA
jgi:geranylgeranyl diphosphate synthase type II